MKTVKIKTTAKRGEKEEHFKGDIAFIDESGKEKKFDWTCIEPEGSDVHLDLIADGKNFLSIHGAPTEEKFLALTQRQKVIIALAIETIPATIRYALPISHKSTKLLEMYDVKSQGSNERSYEVDEKAYNEIFA